MPRKKPSRSVTLDDVQHHQPAQNEPNVFDMLAVIESQKTAMTVEEVARLFKKSAETIRRMASKRQLPSFRMGGSIRFNPASLGYWLRQRDPLAAKASRALASDVRQGALVN